MCRDKQHSSKGFPPSQEGLPKLWRRNKTVSLESVPISYLTIQRMSLSLLWPFPSHILRPPFPSRLVTDLTVLNPPPHLKGKKGGVRGPPSVGIASPLHRRALGIVLTFPHPPLRRLWFFILYFRGSQTVFQAVWLADWLDKGIINKSDYK